LFLASLSLVIQHPKNLIAEDAEVGFGDLKRKSTRVTKRRRLPDDFASVNRKENHVLVTQTRIGMISE